MTNEQVEQLFKAAHNVMNTRDYLESVKSGETSPGGTVKEWEKNLGFAEMQLNSILHELSPSKEVYDSMVFTTHGESDAIEIVNGCFIGVPFYEHGRPVNVRVSIEEI